MYVTKDKNGNGFKWSKKGKNRECEVRDNKCIVRKCFDPDDCGFIDPKTQKKTIIGKCRTMHNSGCPNSCDDPRNFVTNNERIYDKRYR